MTYKTQRRILGDIKAHFDLAQRLFLLDEYSMGFFYSLDPIKWRKRVWITEMSKERGEDYNFATLVTYPYKYAKIFIYDSCFEQWPTLSLEDKALFSLHEIAHIFLWPYTEGIQNHPDKKIIADTEEGICDHLAKAIYKLNPSIWQKLQP